MRGGAHSYWYNGRAPLLTVTRLSDYTVRVECPLPLANYDISSPELLRIAVPAGAYCNDAQCPLKDALVPWTGTNQAAADMLQPPSGCSACVGQGALSDLAGPSILVRAVPGGAQAQGSLVPTVRVEQLRTAQERTPNSNPNPNPNPNPNSNPRPNPNPNPNPNPTPTPNPAPNPNQAERRFRHRTVLLPDRRAG